MLICAVCNSMSGSASYTIKFSPRFDRIFNSLTKKKPSLMPPLLGGIDKIAREPVLGKPTRNILSNQRRIHIAGSFVLLYEIAGTEVRLLDFDHHNKIYKKRHHT